MLAIVSIAKYINSFSCPFCEIYRYEFEGKYFYELYSPVFYCLPCQVHDERGIAVHSTFNSQEYIEKRKDKTLVYKANKM